MDLLPFGTALGKTSGDPGYLVYCDYDGQLDLSDLTPVLRQSGYEKAKGMPRPHARRPRQPSPVRRRPYGTWLGPSRRNAKAMGRSRARSSVGNSHHERTILRHLSAPQRHSSVQLNSAIEVE